LLLQAFNSPAACEKFEELMGSVDTKDLSAADQEFDGNSCHPYINFGSQSWQGAWR
jgi:hypothetical protein